MIYAYTILYVPNVTESIEFYEAAFGFQRKFITPEGDYGELVSGSTTLAFASSTLGESNLKNGFQLSNASDKPFGIELVFTSEDLENDFAKAISAGATIETAVTQKPWGQKVGYLRDNNGFLIEMCTPMST